MVIDKSSKDPVHLDLFRPSVIRGPWLSLAVSIENLQMQQTPNPLAQVPSSVPPL
jgi:hypothetical protein